MNNNTKYFQLIARILVSLIFLNSAPFLFKAATANFASSQGVPFAPVLVPVAAIISVAGAIGIVIGYKTKWAAWLLILFLLPVNLTMNNFWAVADPMQRQIVLGSFLKDLAITGGALLIACFGAGRISFDERIYKLKSSLRTDKK